MASFSWSLEAETPPDTGSTTPGQYDAPAYARQLKQLLPPGAAWLLEQDSLISKCLLGIADTLARVSGRAVDFAAEIDPRTATETLPDWESMLGLPDGCITPIPDTIEERRLAVAQKFIAQGGQSRNYFIALAATCGYVATINDSYGADILRAGFHAGDLCWGLNAAFVWEMVVSPPAGDALSHDVLECVIRRVAPAHTTVFFTYL